MDVVTYALARAYADRLSSGEPAEMRRSGDWIEWRRVGELEWHQLVPLVDIAGPQGLQGIQGPKGEKGDTGEGLKVLGSFDAPEDLPSSNNEVGDAYLISQHLWVWDGDEWVDTGTIQGPKGDTGKSAYQEAVDNGFEGDVEDWLLSLKGEKGDTGEQGPTGAGVPAGGVTGQAMVKASEDDYDTEWSDVIPSRLGPVSPTVDLDNVSESGWSSDGTSAVETIVYDSGRTQTRYGENGLIESRTHDGAEWTEWVRASGTDIQAGDGISVTGDESEPVVSVDDSVMRLDRAETVTGEKTVTTIKVTNSGSIAPSSDNGSFTVGSSASTRPNVQLSGPNNRGQLRVGTTVAATWTNTGLHAGDSNAPGDLLATRSYVDDFNVLPDGGTTGQVLSKASDDDGDVEWTDPPSGGEEYGAEWTARTAAEANLWNSVTYGNGVFVAVSLDGTNRVMTSPDGITWTARSATEDNSWRSVTYGNGLFVAVSSNGTNRVMTSPDGVNWTARNAAEQNGWQSVTYGNGLFVAVSSNGTNRVMTSPDGITWTARSAAEANWWQSVTYGNSLFVAVAIDGTNRVMTSPDGVSWTAHTAAEDNSWRSVTYGNGLFVAVAQTGTNRVMTSPDGITWTGRTAADQASWQSVTYGNGLFVAVAVNRTSRVMTSPDGITWTARSAAEQNSWFSVTYGNGLFVAVAQTGTNRVMTSEAPPSYITGVGVSSIVSLTQAEYDTLATKDPATLYVVTS